MGNGLQLGLFFFLPWLVNIRNGLFGISFQVTTACGSEKVP